MIYKFSIRTGARSHFLPLDGEIQRCINESGVKSGVCHVFIPHTTAGVTVNENADPDVVRDIINTLDRMVPWDDDYAHTEGNSAAHIKSSMVGCEKTIIIENGSLALGTWQSVFFCEFDGPRTRQVWLEIK